MGNEKCQHWHRRVGHSRKCGYSHISFHSIDTMYFWFPGRHFEFQWSGHVSSITSKLGIVENVGLAAGISLTYHSIPWIHSTSWPPSWFSKIRWRLVMSILNYYVKKTVTSVMMSRYITLYHVCDWLQHYKKSTANRKPYSITSICCAFVVESTTNPQHLDILRCCGFVVQLRCTTNPPQIEVMEFDFNSRRIKDTNNG